MYISQLHDDSCVVKHDLQNYVMGEVRQFSSISNLRTLLLAEGFHNVKLAYIEGLWVMVELESSKVKTKFMKHVGVGSWFSRLCDAQSDFVSRDRIVWVDIEGVPLHAWSRSTFFKIGSKWGEVMELEENKDDMFAHDTEVGYCTEDESVKADEGVEKNVGNRDTNSKHSNLEAESDVEAVSDTYFGDQDDKLETDQDAVNSVNDKETSNDPFGFYDLLKKRNKGVDNLSVWIRRDLVHDYGGDSFQDTEFILLQWYVDNFVALYGTWIPNKSNLLIISVYALQSITDKRSLCERLGSIFNAQGAYEFNNFISNSGLVEIQLEGYAFTWSHTSAAKMNHRPILLREVLSDYGATPFRLYHSWLSLQGFAQMVTNTWNSIVLDDRNGMILVSLIILLRGVSDELLLSRLNLMKQLQDIKTAKACDFMQKAKVRWAIEGDENSKFFHGVINKKRVNLSIKGVMVDGEWVDDPCRVKDEFQSHFASRFQDPGTMRSRLNFMFPNRLSSDQATDLESPVTTDEIRNAVWACGENKSPGPDGFTFEFFRMFWNVIGPDMSVAVEWFFNHNSFSRGCNSSFVSLVPKIPDPKIVSDYRPISLIGSLYKVITKILATRLSLVISDLISDVQTAFLPNRQILDGPFIINELLSWCKLKKQQAMVFKVDFAKAYDTIRWDYLDDVLEAFGFGDKWRSWITGSLVSGMASILINGSVGVSNSNVSAAAANLGCSVMTTPFKYLGVMVGGNMSKIKAWDDTIGRLKSRLSKWKLNTLSIGGRLTLLKSVLGSTPIYSMSLYKVPKSVLNSMEAIRRDFFNGVQRDEKKITWVKWSKVLASKKYGGLGVSSFYALNRALLFKWVWRFISKDNSLWSRLISSIHGSQFQVHSSRHPSTWNVIVREVIVLKNQGIDLLSHCKIRVGSGLHTSFWNAIWLGDTAFSALFPRIYALEINKDCTVADKLQGPFSLSFRRPVRGGAESQQLDQIQTLIGPIILSSLVDRWIWDLNGEGTFRVQDARNLLDEFFLPKDPVATRWVKSAPIKVNVFAWKLHLDRLPTRMNLARKVIWPSILVGSCVVGGNWHGCLSVHTRNGLFGLNLFGWDLRLKGSWKEFSIRLGGAYGTSGTNYFLRLKVHGKMFCLMILFPVLLLGVMLDVEWRVTKNIRSDKGVWCGEEQVKRRERVVQQGDAYQP
ncbi:RNA-directed DNA polymerase, eukaryota [Tanacetum coccineum]|uniref:RNA-directed DNA polymerase, eukaryota n=1 Tax=Tanacetum coccineum TaxID=301880 RepID=A0ABQ4ZZ19_9ASTR